MRWVPAPLCFPRPFFPHSTFSSSLKRPYEDVSFARDPEARSLSNSGAHDRSPLSDSKGKERNFEFSQPETYMTPLAQLPTNNLFLVSFPPPTVSLYTFQLFLFLNHSATVMEMKPGKQKAMWNTRYAITLQTGIPRSAAESFVPMPYFMFVIDLPMCGQQKITARVLWQHPFFFTAEIC